MADKSGFKRTDIRTLIKQADPKPSYYPTYQTSGRTFIKRDTPGPKPNNQS